MKTLTLLCNIVLFGFTSVVVATDGPPQEMPYIIFTLFLLLVPIFNVFVIVRSGAGNGWLSLPMKRNTSETQPNTGVLSFRKTAIERVAALCNVVLLGVVCWAIVDQYPHPEEEGVVAYSVLTVLTPILSAVALFRSGLRTPPPASRRT